MDTYPTHHHQWKPPHCPNPHCKYHNDLLANWPVIRFGYFWRQARPHRIRRYRCKHCRVTFSSQTFDTTYYLKRPDILPQLMTKATGWTMAKGSPAWAATMTSGTVDMPTRSAPSPRIIASSAQQTAGENPCRGRSADGGVFDGDGGEAFG